MAGNGINRIKFEIFFEPGKTHLAVLWTDILDVFVHIAEDDGCDVTFYAKHGSETQALA